MSRIRGLDTVTGRLGAYETRVAEALGVLIEARMMDLQKDMVATVPRATGRMAEAYADPEALDFKRDARNFVKRGRFGLLNNRLGRMGFHAFFVEFGTKGYKAGQARFAGKVKRSGKWFYINPATFKGRPDQFETRSQTNAKGVTKHQARRIDGQRFQTLKRDVPARPANPFIRPAFARFYAKMERDRALAKVAAAAWAATASAPTKEAA